MLSRKTILCLVLLGLCITESLASDTDKKKALKKKILEKLEKAKKVRQYSCEKDATYTVVNDCVWNGMRHPRDYPAGSSHWSPLCGTTHTAEFEMYKVGGLSTPGVQLVAETGSHTILKEEVDQCIADNYCGKYYQWACSKFSGTCQHTGKFGVTTRYRYFSAVSMIAPSPDWMVGVSNVNLCKDGYWMKEYSMDLYALDAGTDSGETFKSSNALTDPFKPISVFNQTDLSNIFYNDVEKKLYPMCKITLKLEA